MEASKEGGCQVTSIDHLEALYYQKFEAYQTALERANNDKAQIDSLIASGRDPEGLLIRYQKQMSKASSYLGEAQDYAAQVQALRPNVQQKADMSVLPTENVIPLATSQATNGSVSVESPSAAATQVAAVSSLPSSGVNVGLVIAGIILLSRLK